MPNLHRHHRTSKGCARPHTFTERTKVFISKCMSRVRISRIARLPSLPDTKRSLMSSICVCMCMCVFCLCLWHRFCVCMSCVCLHACPCMCLFLHLSVPTQSMYVYSMRMCLYLMDCWVVARLVLLTHVLVKVLPFLVR